MLIMEDNGCASGYDEVGVRRAMPQVGGRKILFVRHEAINFISNLVEVD